MDIELFRKLSVSERLSFMRAQPSLVTLENCDGFRTQDFVSATRFRANFLDEWYNPGIKLPLSSWITLYVEFPERFKPDPLILSQFPAVLWDQLLMRDPRFAAYLEEYCKTYGAGKFSASDWEMLLSHKETWGIADYCPIAKFTRDERLAIALKCPLLADAIDFEKFKPYDWGRTIQRCPDIAEYYRVENLSTQIRAAILRMSPDVADKIRVDDFSSSEICDVLLRQPQLAEKFDISKITGHDWLYWVAKNDSLAEQACVENFTGDDWIEMLLCDTKVAWKLCRQCKWNKFSVKNWNDLLTKKSFDRLGHPIFHCPFPEKLSDEAWRAVLRVCIELRQLCPRDVLTSYDWVKIITNDPLKLFDCDLSCLKLPHIEQLREEIERNITERHFEFYDEDLFREAAQKLTAVIAEKKQGVEIPLGRVDQYTLIRKLGEGGFGAVFLAKDTVAKMHVAIKGLPSVIGHNIEECEKIRKNFVMVSRLHHPNIASALVLHQARKVFYSNDDVANALRVSKGEFLMVMEYANGETLSDWVKRLPLSSSRYTLMMEVLRQIATALDFAHSQDIIHRDIKPSNVIVSHQFGAKIVAKVLDFGLAAEMHTAVSRASLKVTDRSGTYVYMAPEQWKGTKQGPATDQYALAALSYEMLFDAPPYVRECSDGGIQALGLAVLTGQPHFDSTVPAMVQKVFLKGLDKVPEKRFGGCVEFVEALCDAMCIEPHWHGINDPVAEDTSSTNMGHSCIWYDKRETNGR